MAYKRALRAAALLCLVTLVTPLAFAQQTGSISGIVSTGGSGLPGVTVEASSNLLPQPRVTVTSGAGDYRLPALPPGEYTVRFDLSGMATQTRTIRVNLGQESTLNATMGMDSVSESITVVADSSLIDTTSTEIKSALSSEALEQLPVGQEYRDLVKLTPGVQHTENAVRGPSGGGSGQDNVYLFDGVAVTLPLFGTLSAEPSSLDIQQLSVIRGGARAIDFNRAAGFTIDSVSKSGTNQWKGALGYQVMTAAMRGKQDNAVAKNETERTWGNVNLGGPLVQERLFFFGSYYRPTVDLEDRSNRYGALPDFTSRRDEVFGKLTFTPTQSILLHGSYRNSDRENIAESIADLFSAPSTAGSSASSLKIGILEGSLIVTPRSFATFKFTDFANETVGRPNVILSANPSLDGSVPLNIAALETQGLFFVPRPVTGNAAFNSFIAPLIERYGFLENGVRTGGGRIGAASQINDQDFFRQNFQVGYNFTLGTNLRHDIHFGYQWYTDQEDLTRSSNGFGAITVPGPVTGGGRPVFNGQPVFFQAEFVRPLVAGADPRIVSEYQSQNVELNDSITLNNWTFNLGVLVSEDTLFGQGLRENRTTISGYEAAPGNRYEMYEIPWDKMIQPRVGATWAYNGSDNVYVNYARYNPAGSSLPRAASWDRNNLNLIYRAFFDQNGRQIGVQPVASSSGKLFVENLDPRYTDEYLIGTSQQITSGLTGRLYSRYRYSTNFWEDTNNDARIRFNPPAGVPRELYIPDLAARTSQIGSGSSYVIAELDGAFTKYIDATVETEWRNRGSFVRGSYTWSHYYGNFDQDNTTTFNDQNIFIGSSNLADGAGRQIWDNKYGELNGDRRHLLKLYGYQALPWSATIGAFGLYQSGEPWETHSFVPYIGVGGNQNTSDVNRYAEPAGSRRADDHYQLDMNYIQNLPIAGLNLQLAIDAFNVTDNQTGFNINPNLSSAGYGQPQSLFAPRRFQVGLKLEF